jgi:predicted esterase
MSRTLTIFFIFLLHQALCQTPGEVTDTVVCKAAPDQSYSLYVPSSYQQKKKIGLILFFEPAARGSLPVSLYKGLAEKYSLILACSNNSRNGAFEVSQKAGKVVLEDLLQRFTIDTSFILASGFSGGGRMASRLAMSDPRIRGAIACGAAFPPSQKITPEKKVPYVEIIGDVDMNYLEAINTFDYLVGISNPVHLAVFHGGHGWPPAETYDQAIQWHRYKRGWLNQQQSNEYYSMREQQVRKQIDSLQFSAAHRNLLSLRADFTQGKLKDKTDSILKKLTDDKEFKKVIKKTEKAYAQETKLREQFVTTFYQQVKNAAPDSTYDKGAWEDFRRIAQSLISSQEAVTHQAGLRLQDYFWRFCAEQYSQYEAEQQYRQATLCAKVWTIMTPENPVPFYLTAKGYAFQNNKTPSLKYLSQAIDKGFKKPALLTREKAFSSFQSDPLFLSLIKKIKQ